jgi:DNA-binding transcriptional ArsR family regulator
MKQAGIKPSAKIVLYWLADHHNGETGRCFPSLKTLERECEMSRPAIIRHLSALEDAGLISRDQRKRENGSQTSTAYRLHLVPVTKRNPPCSETLQPPVTNQDPLNLGTINHGNEQEDTGVSLSVLPCSVVDVEKAFDEFWEHYPRKIKKKDAKTSFAKAAKKHKTDDILFGLSQQIDTMKSKEQQFIPHAATWLNAERWTDEPEQPNNTNNLHGRRAGSQAGQRPDASLERIARLAGVVPTSGDDRF